MRDSEREALRALLYDTLLMSVHPMVIHNVEDALRKLLTTIRRPDLAALVGDPERLHPSEKRPKTKARRPPPDIE